jgi:hypothetical protein
MARAFAPSAFPPSAARCKNSHDSAKFIGTPMPSQMHSTVPDFGTFRCRDVIHWRPVPDLSRSARLNYARLLLASADIAR